MFSIFRVPARDPSSRSLGMGMEKKGEEVSLEKTISAPYPTRSHVKSGGSECATGYDSRLQTSAACCR